MATEISNENERFIEEEIAKGRFRNRREALDEAVRLLREEADTLQAIQEGLDSIDRGEGTPLDEAVEQLRRKYDITPDA